MEVRLARAEAQPAPQLVRAMVAQRQSSEQMASPLPNKWPAPRTPATHEALAGSTRPGRWNTSPARMSGRPARGVAASGMARR